MKIMVKIFSKICTIADKIKNTFTGILEFSTAQRLIGGTNFMTLKCLAILFLSMPFYFYMMRMKKKARNACRQKNLGGWVEFIHGFAIYVIVRQIKPQIIVETGVGPGSTSAFILKALKDNDRGMLYSIDLPGNDAVVYPMLGKSFNVHIPNGFEVGWLIPPAFKNRWKLILGDSKEELPKLLKELGTIDIFLHDSLHTDEHILMEFKIVMSYIRQGGILLCDDVNSFWSTTFITFCKEYNIPYFVFNDRLGIGKVIS
ncbi:MAG: class I SAM-dependent methyltransferase [Candidatus Omnitrophota bacterium]